GVSAGRVVATRPAGLRCQTREMRALSATTPPGNAYHYSYIPSPFPTFREPSAMSNTGQMAQTDIDSIQKLKSAFDNIKKQLTRVIVGQDQVIEELLIALFSRGHCM